MELTNAIPKHFISKEAPDAEKSAVDEALKSILIMLSPIVPHITHKLWKDLEEKKAIIDASWPEVEKGLLKDEVFHIAVQINGKLRASLEVDVNTSQEEIEVLAQAEKTIEKYLSHKKITKKIHVPGRLLNIVTE